MTTFFDTSALIALTKDTEEHHQWSREQFEAGKSRGPIVISPVVFSEYCVGMDSLEHVRQSLQSLGIESLTEDEAALFRASRAYIHYKTNNKGPKLSLLPDFLIGAAAETLGRPLVSTNERDFLKYFEGLHLIHPARRSSNPA
ncbi:type II toxin-antitoxin system VapC family toxin [Mesorhizobium sp. L-8-3]|uniref:type II toxin-antitoxin system VapC family toxin n=1 Tax=Mesorhizobium sp. L-8-3 TaxID=2744522 RepID=UPI00192869F2|nr:type II toxin-antitoxin system VapC family toxin [Mesorhizobium sp. L-8-3]BCH24112.1 DNA-binding protein [Mesorhizobium sp. L-8-3]